MLRYCIVCENVVKNVILWDGQQDFNNKENCEIIQNDIAGIGWKYVNGEFIAPPDPQEQKQDLIELVKSKKQFLIANATKKIDPLSDSVELGMATDKEIADLKAWKMYRVMLSRVDPEKTPEIIWPSPP